MAREKGIIDTLKLWPVIKSMPRKKLVEEMVEAVGTEELLTILFDRLTPQERAAVLRRFQQPPPETK